MVIRWMKAVDWMTGHPFIVISGYRFEPGMAVETNDQDLIGMARGHPDFSVEEEAKHDQTKEQEYIAAQAEEDKPQDQSQNKTGYAPVKKKKPKKKKDSEDRPPSDPADRTTADT